MTSPRPFDTHRQPRTRRTLAAALAAALLLASLLWLLVGRNSAARVGPDAANVVVVMTDDATMRDLRVMDRTRGLMGERGVDFVNSFATLPLCAPSRATFLTGQYAHNHGVRANDEGKGAFENFDDSGSVPQTLRAAGYRTGFVGKYMNGLDIEERVPGWDLWAAKKGGVYDYELNRNGEIEQYGSKPSDYQTDVTGEISREFISRSAQRDEPFFLFTSFSAPHGERGGDSRRYNPRPAERHTGAFDGRKAERNEAFDESDVSDKPRAVRESGRLKSKRKRTLDKRVESREASLLAVDEQIEGIYEELEAAGVEDETYVIFTSDNGYLFGEHRQTAKTLLYENSIRVPLLMTGPGLPEGAERGGIVGNIDLAATIYDVAGVEPGRTQDGISLVDAARDPELRSDRALLIQNEGSAGVRAPGWVYIEYDATKEYELYDLRRDPQQLDNLLDPETGELRTDRDGAALERDRLRAELERLRGCKGEGCRGEIAREGSGS
ncbi:sulfatase-like hydrolase/transferase [Thermoleophilia bacterium SCSIO 60948]|nr:sulfatase-like hydrolase/transferase [Thermoleophilia bacterium SCSIO 60948]